MIQIKTISLKTIIILVQLLIVNFSLLNETEATIRYVSKTGSSTPPYTSWATAADSIQKCINICENGDTIYVANGIYKDSIYVNKFLVLIGSSMDSTIISSQGLYPRQVVRFFYGGEMRNFRIIGMRKLDFYQQGIVISGNVVLKDCLIENVAWGLIIGGSASKIQNCIFKDFEQKAIFDESITGTQLTLYKDNIMIATKVFRGTFIVDFGFLGNQTFVGNILMAEKNVDVPRGVKFSTEGIVVYNNLVFNAGYTGIQSNPMGGTQKIINNLVLNTWRANGSSISTNNGSLTVLKNNILMRSKNGIERINTPTVRSDYNLFYECINIISGQQQLIGDGNLINYDPMFVNDTVVTLSGTWDFHLQAYSPAIDKGDPTILDPDGSRSDIGMYGGPFGEVYTYQDLSPRPPRNLSAVVDSGRVRLKWNKNTEADTSHYRIYRSLTPNFIIDTTNLIGTSTDTNYVDILTQSYQRLYYRITCVDRQGNQSGPSEQLEVNLVSINEYPSLVRDYYLYQNYPNPFNPTTKIGYKLKERGYVKLMLYDIKGERISVLVNEEKEAGYYEVEFDANQYQLNNRETISGNPIASGIYLYRIEVIGEGNIPVYTEMRKMVLVK
jgi:hypothetical protein